MALLLTILSVLAGWALLAVLSVGLLLILKPLQSVRCELEKITMGVRAIERQTMPLGARAAALAGSLNQTSTAINSTGERLAETETQLNAAAPALSSRRSAP